MAKPAKTQSRGPFCQSCGMPMEGAADFGTESTGLRNNDYCHYCYVNGAFTNPQLSMTGMVDFCVKVMAGRRLMPEAEARTLMATVIPKLKRWRAGMPVGA